MSDSEPEGPGWRVLAPLYAAGFVTAFGAHAVAANLGGYGIAHHTSLWELGLLLGIYDLAEIVLKPVFGTLSDRIGPKPVLLGGLVAFALASGAFVVAGHAQWLGAARPDQRGDVRAGHLRRRELPVLVHPQCDPPSQRHTTGPCRRCAPQT